MTDDIILFFVLAFVLYFVLVAIFQWLWNMTMPQVFGLRVIRYWQAFRLLLIAAFLFGGTHLPSFNFKW